MTWQPRTDGRPGETLELGTAATVGWYADEDGTRLFVRWGDVLGEAATGVGYGSAEAARVHAMSFARRWAGRHIGQAVELFTALWEVGT